MCLLINKLFFLSCANFHNLQFNPLTSEVYSGKGFVSVENTPAISIFMSVH